MKKQLLNVAAIALLLSVFVSSCSSYKYTNYGRPFDFLHAKKFKAEPLDQDKELASNDDKEYIEVSNSNDVVEVFSEKEEVLAQQTESSSIEKSVAVEKVASNESNEEEVSVNEVSSEEVITSNAVTEEVEVMNDVSKKDIKRSFKSIKDTSHKTSSDDLLIILLCIFLPPLAVFLVLDIGKEFWIDLLLWLFLFGLGGVIYAFIVCF